MTHQSGLAVLKKYGKEYFKQLRKKVKKESLSAGGKIGSAKVRQLYGIEHFHKISGLSGKKFSEKIKADSDLKAKYRNMFIERMKKFTRRYPTKSGIKVRSKIEQKIANTLTENGIFFQYESLNLKTDFGDCQPDFVINDHVILEIFGMDTTFYLKKKIPKISDAIGRNQQYNWLIFTTISQPIDVKNCKIITNESQLLKEIRGLINP